MDPLTAMGIASNVIAFIDFGAGLLRGAVEIHNSLDGTLDDNKSRETVIREAERFYALLKISHEPTPPAGSFEHRSIYALAQECHAISARILTLLQNIKTKDARSKRQSLVSALRSKFYEKDREELEGRLANCRGQLDLQLSRLTGKEMLDELSTLVKTSSSAHQTTLETLCWQVDQLQRRIDDSTITCSPTARKGFEQLLSDGNKAFRPATIETILKKISFDGMRQRSDMVVETHPLTFKWILADGSEPHSVAAEDSQSSAAEELRVEHEDFEKARARQLFRSWLRNEHVDEIFHISGKLGSGKSTLMKMFGSSLRNNQELKLWAGNHKLAVVQFYFWTSGSKSQRSLSGLYRTLLHDILEAYPDLVATPGIVPHNKANTRLSDQDIRDAFQRLVGAPHLFHDKRLCILVDGLDEFQPTADYDHRDLVELLMRWNANSAGHVKICVSSREHNVFMSKFSQHFRIRLQDLIRRDIELYIRDRLDHVKKDSHFQHLVSSLMEKANGIFLWVALVIRSVRESIEDGMSCSELVEQVDILPQEMTELYRHIMDTLPRLTQRQAYQTFRMISKLKSTARPVGVESEYRMSLLSHSFLERYNNEPGFSHNEMAAKSPETILGTCDDHRLSLLRMRLSGCCKGLVETYARRIPGLDDRLECAQIQKWAFDIDFTHRSVSEFLGSADVDRRINLALGAFDHWDALNQLLIVDLLFDRGISSRTSKTVGALVRISRASALDERPYLGLERARKVGASHDARIDVPASSQRMVAVFRGGVRSVADVQDYGQDTTIWTQGTTDRMRSGCEWIYLTDPIFYCLESWQFLYPEWRIQNAIGIQKDSAAVNIMACVASFRVPRVLEALLERKLLDPDAVAMYRPTTLGWHMFYHRGNLADLTIWQCLVLNWILLWYSWEGDDLDRVPDPTWKKISESVRILLKLEPDLQLEVNLILEQVDSRVRNEIKGVAMRDPGDSCGESIPDAEFESRDIEPRLCFKTGSGNEVEFKPRFSMTRCETWQDENLGLPGGIVGAKRTVTLRNFVQFGPLQNKDELLAMLDAQLSNKKSRHALRDQNTRAGVDCLIPSVASPTMVDDIKDVFVKSSSGYGGNMVESVLHRPFTALIRSGLKLGNGGILLLGVLITFLLYQT